MAQIIPKILPAVEPDWQKELANAFTRPQDLLAYLNIWPKNYVQHAKARQLFPMRVPRAFAERMQKGDIQDPLLKQVMPWSDEFLVQPGFSADPLDEQNNQQAGLLHKYQSRVLLLVRGGCAVNCRYCFRRHFPYADNHLNRDGWLKVLDYIQGHPELNEVIYSGGDPLMAKDDFLAWLSGEISQIAHIKRLRIHTRLPVVIPNRINANLLDWLGNSQLQNIMVLHINHANEIDGALQRKLQQLKQAGVTLFNQSVLLKGVNNDGQALAQLSERLFEVGVMPYYLHLLDKVQGAGHFEVDEQQARVLMAGLIKRLPGFLVPKLVTEIGGQPGKTPIDLHLG